MEANQVSSLSETLSGQKESIFADDTSLGPGDSARSRSLSVLLRSSVVEFVSHVDVGFIIFMFTLRYTN